jgi:serine-type D-Ala-D-Ala carboxypeptidase/endopeptidase
MKRKANWQSRLLGGGMALCLLAMPAQLRADALLDEIASFNGQVLFLQLKVPALIIGAVRDGETTVAGFGARSPGGPEPDGDTLFRIGSITKAFTGEVLAHAVERGAVGLADTLLPQAPQFEGSASDLVQRIRLLDLVTHAGGLPREVPHEPGPDGDPFATITKDAFLGWLKENQLLFPPGTGILYSNFGFDLLAIALSEATGTPYPELLEEFVTGPRQMSDTVFEPNEEQEGRIMAGHDFDGEPLPVIPTGTVILGSGGLYSTANDLLRWMQWHLDRNDQDGDEVRALDHAIYRVRDGLDPVSGMDESGHMDGMGLGWVAMMPEGSRPFILQKAGGLQGTFSYIAFAPERRVAAFVVINTFDFGAAIAMAGAVNEMIATLAPR